MEELEKLFGDNLDAVITLYKCCETSKAGVYVEQLKPEELTDEQKLHIAKFTKTMKSNGKVLNVCDWVALAGNSVDSGPIWAWLQGYLDKIPNENVRKLIRKKSIKPQYFEVLDKEVPEGCEGLTVDEIYEETGKIVPKILIKNKNKNSPVPLAELDKVINELQEKIDDALKLDREKVASSILSFIRNKYKNKRIHKNKLVPPMYIRKLKEEFNNRNNRMEITGEQLSYPLFNMMVLEGYKPAVISPFMDGSGDYNSWELLEVTDFNEVYVDSGKALMEQYDAVCKIGLYKPDRTLQHLQFTSKIGVHTTIDKDFIVNSAKHVLEKEHKGKPLHQYIKENYLQQPKSFYVLKKKSGIYEWHFLNIALDIYHYENVVIPPYALERFKPIFGGKTPDEWINNFKEI